MCSCFFWFSSPFFRSLYIRLNIQRDFCLDYAVIKGRVMVTPLVILFFRDLSCPEFLFFFRPGHQPRIQFRCFYSAFGNVGTETDQTVSIQDLDQFPILQRKQRVHQPVHGINVRNSDCFRRDIQCFCHRSSQICLRRPILTFILRHAHICRIVRKSSQHKSQILLCHPP